VSHTLKGGASNFGQRCFVFEANLVVFGSPADDPSPEVNVRPSELSDSSDPVARFVGQDQRQLDLSTW